MVSNKPYSQEVQPPANSKVRGRVFYENTGRPVRRTSITLITKEAGQANEFSGLTDSNGYFEIENVRAGTYYAFVNAPGVVSPLAYTDVSQPRSLGLADEAVANFQPIVVNGINDVNVEIPAKQGGAISGRIMYSNGDPVIGAKVEILRKVEDRFVPVISNFSAIFSIFRGGSDGFQTDDRGVYRFAGLPAGEYIVKVSENVSHSDSRIKNYDPFENMLFGGYSLLTIYYPEAFETEKAEIINVIPGQEKYEINMTIPDRDLYRVEGKVISAKTKLPIENATISIKRVGNNTSSIFENTIRNRHDISTDKTGDWSFKELPKGTYKVTINATEKIPVKSNSGNNSNTAYSYNAGVYAENYAERKYAAKTQEIVIEDKNLSDIVVELGFGATISGTVFTENDKSMPSSLTVYASYEDSESYVLDSVQNYSENQQNLNHEFKLEAVASGKSYFKVLVVDDDFYVKSATAGNRDLLAETIELSEGEILSNVKVVLGKDVGTIKGKVFNTNNEPAAKAELTLVPTDARKRKNSGFYRYITTDENGEFTIKAAPYEYAVVIVDRKIAVKNSKDLNKWLDEAITSAQKITVKSNETTVIRLLLP